MRRRSFARVFREFVPDLTPPDREGWAGGTCPYCRAAGAFRCNVFTARWVCLPTPGRGRSEDLAPPCTRRRLTVDDLRAWAARYGFELPPLVEGAS